MTTFHSASHDSKLFNFGVRRKIFSHHIIVPAIATLMLAVTPAMAAMGAEKWVACDGTVATSATKDGKTETTSAPAKDTYAYNDATKMLFKYSDARKSLDPVFVTGYDDKAITWANAGTTSPGSTAATWQGRLDRSNLALSLTRSERGEVMTWTQQCKMAPPK